MSHLFNLYKETSCYNMIYSLELWARQLHDKHFIN